MAILLLAEHDNNAIKPATLNAVTAAAKIGGDVSSARRRPECEGSSGSWFQDSRHRQGAAVATTRPMPTGWPRTWRPLLVKLAPAYSHVAGGDHRDQQERHAAGGGAARRGADSPTSSASNRRIPSCG